MDRSVVKVVMVVVLAALPAIPAFGFSRASFRYQSTAGLLEDDLDLMMVPGTGLMDPARLPLIDGGRLYTGLSNLTDGQERALADSTGRSFLIGITSPLRGGANFAVLHHRMSEQIPGLTGLTDRSGAPLLGTGRTIETTFLDMDGNGSYDSQSEVDRSVEVWDEENFSEYACAFGGYAGEVRVGAYFILSDSSGKSTTDGPDVLKYGETTIRTNLITGDITFLDDQTKSGMRDESYNRTTLGLSAWYPMNDRLDLGGHLSYRKSSSEENAYWDYVQVTDHSPQQQDSISTFERQERAQRSVPLSGNRLSLGTSAIYRWNDRIVGRADLFYTKTTNKISKEAPDDLLVWENTYTSFGGREERFEVNNRSIGEIDGDDNSDDVDLRLKMISELSDKVTFGFGFDFGMGRFEQDWVKEDSTSNVAAYYNGDGVLDSLDYTLIETRGERITTRTTSADRTIRLPVCVEFHISRPLVMRLGAEHLIEHIERTTTETVDSYSAPKYRKELGDGTVTEWVVEDSLGILSGSSMDEVSTSSVTTYTSGIGWTVSSNLVIDIMGFSNLVDLTGWRLSATLRFF